MLYVHRPCNGQQFRFSNGPCNNPPTFPEVSRPGYAPWLLSLRYQGPSSFGPGLQIQPPPYENLWGRTYGEFLSRMLVLRCPDNYQEPLLTVSYTSNLSQNNIGDCPGPCIGELIVSPRPDLGDHTKGTEMRTPNREPQEYSRKIRGISLPGPLYSYIKFSLYIPEVPYLRFPIHSLYFKGQLF